MAWALIQAEVGILPKEVEEGVIIKAPILSRAVTSVDLILGHLRVSHVVARTWAPIKDKIAVLHRTRTRLTQPLEAQLWRMRSWLTRSLARFPWRARKWSQGHMDTHRIADMPRTWVHHK